MLCLLKTGIRFRCAVLREVHVGSEGFVQIHGERTPGVPLLDRDRSLLIVGISQGVVHKAMVCFIGANHKQSVAESRVLGKAPVVLRDLRSGAVLQRVAVDSADHFRVGIDGVLLQEPHETMGSAWCEDEQEGKERDEGELRDADEELLYRREFRVGAHGEEVHSLVLRLVDEGLDPGVWLQTAETPQVMEIAAHQSGNGGDALQKYRTQDVVFSEIRVSNLEEGIHNPRGNTVTHPLGVALWLLAPAGLKNREILPIAGMVLGITARAISYSRAEDMVVFVRFLVQRLRNALLVNELLIRRDGEASENDRLPFEEDSGEDREHENGYAAQYPVIWR